MLAQWAFVIISPFMAPPTPLAPVESPVVPLTVDARWFRARCLSTRCGDEEWRSDTQPDARVSATRRKPRLPGVQPALPLRAPARRRDSYRPYSNDWRIGTRYGYQLVRDGDTRLGVEFGAGYRLAPLHDDGVSAPGPVFRGGINLGTRVGERTQFMQRVQFETGNGDYFVKQRLGLDVELAPEWMLETDYVTRYDSRGTSGTDTAEAWLGVRREF